MTSTGHLKVRIDGQLKVLKQGDTLHIPAGKVHSMWNGTDGKTVLNWKAQPTMDTENLLETISGLAIDGKTNDEAKPDILQVA